MFQPENYFSFWTQKAFHSQTRLLFSLYIKQTIFVYFGTKGGHMLNAENKFLRDLSSRDM